MLRWLLLVSALAVAPAQAQNFGSDFAVTTVPTVQNAAYSAGNSLGGLLTIPAFRPNNPAGLFSFLWLAVKSGGIPVGGLITVYIFDVKPTASTCTDKAAFSLNTADMPKVAFSPPAITMAVPQSGTMSSGQSTVALSVRNGDSPISQNVYACLVLGGALTPANTTDILFTIGLSQD